MLKGEEQRHLAELRIELRAIDAEIAGMRRESRRYRQMRFGLDIKEIQLTALQDQRDACAERLVQLRNRLGLERRREHPLAWLLLPVVIWIELRQMLSTPSDKPEVKTQEPATSFAPSLHLHLDEVRAIPQGHVTAGVR